MAGFREFLTGEVLTAANVDDFLMKQSVQKYADAAARDAALGTAVAGGNALREGMVAWLDDDDELQAYDGSAWNAVSGGGLVQVVTATDSTQRVTTSLTFVTGTLSAAITPTAIGNTVIVIWAALAQTAIAPGIEMSASFRVTQGGTAVEGAENAELGIRAAQAATLNKIITPFTLVGLYTTVGTSSVTFETEFRLNLGTNVALQNDSMTGKLVLAEVSV